MLEYWEDIQDEAHRGIRGVPGDNRNQELHCKAALDPYSMKKKKRKTKMIDRNQTRYWSWTCSEYTNDPTCAIWYFVDIQIDSMISSKEAPPNWYKWLFMILRSPLVTEHMASKGDGKFPPVTLTFFDFVNSNKTSFVSICSLHRTEM